MRNKQPTYCLQLIESALETIMDDGWGKHFKHFSSEEKQEVIDDVIKAFDEDGLFILRDKYVIPGKSGVLSAEDFKINEELFHNTEVDNYA